MGWQFLTPTDLAGTRGAVITSSGEDTGYTDDDTALYGEPFTVWRSDGLPSASWLQHDFGADADFRSGVLMLDNINVTSVTLTTYTDAGGLTDTITPIPTAQDPVSGKYKLWYPLTSVSNNIAQFRITSPTDIVTDGISPARLQVGSMMVSTAINAWPQPVSLHDETPTTAGVALRSLADRGQMVTVGNPFGRFLIRAPIMNRSDTRSDLFALLRHFNQTWVIYKNESQVAECYVGHIERAVPVRQTSQNVHGYQQFLWREAA